MVERAPSGDVKRLQVGVGVVVVANNREILLGVRRDTQQYALPGGRARPSEPLRACAMRELREETGLQCEAAHAFMASVETISGQRWISVGFLAPLKSCAIAPEEREPDKIGQWRWCSTHQLCHLDLYPPSATLLRSFARRQWSNEHIRS